MSCIVKSLYLKILPNPSPYLDGRTGDTSPPSLAPVIFRSAGSNLTVLLQLLPDQSERPASGKRSRISSTGATRRGIPP